MVAKLEPKSARHVPSESMTKHTALTRSRGDHTCNSPCLFTRTERQPHFGTSAPKQCHRLPNVCRGQTLSCVSSHTICERVSGIANKLTCTRSPRHPMRR